MDLLSIDQAMHFPFDVIELPKESYHLQSKTKMTVASANMGGIGYGGPSCTHHLARWKHIATFYIFKLSAESYYLAQSLTCHPH
jgi:hypothetical protein